ncbi:MAG: hypothetical protein AAF267_18710 [Deinococcota bacterium]
MIFSDPCLTFGFLASLEFTTLATKCNYIGVLFALLCFLLSGCFPEPTINDTSVLQIVNQPIKTENYEALVCARGLRSKITYPHLNLVVIEETAPNNSTRRELFPNQDDQGNDLIFKGMTVIGEAWCYDAENNEIGYVKEVEDFLDATPLPSLQVYAIVEPPNVDPQGQCNASTSVVPLEVRGNPPCIAVFGN